MDRREKIKRPEVIFLDVGETIFHPYPSFGELFRTVCLEHGVDVDPREVARSARRHMETVEEMQGKGFSFTDHPEKSREFWLGFYHSILGELGCQGEDHILPKALYRTFSDPSLYRPYPDVKNALDILRDLGFRLGVITNFEPWVQDLLDGWGISPYLDHVVISGLLGREKPHPAIFLEALRMADVLPEDALHVGDSIRSDFQGARDVGMQAVLIDRRGSHPDFRGPRIANLLELPDLFEGDRG
ncbi:MAG: HAD-IA family hydrolase [Candidatus Geothermincolales bacterium]